MGRGVNRVTLVGNLGRDPEMRSTANGSQVANFSVATAESVKRDGQWEDHTEWHRCVAFARTAEIVGQYLSKGSQVYLEGKLRTRKYTDKQGIEKTSTEILVDVMNMLGGQPRNEGGGGSRRQIPDSWSGTQDQAPARPAAQQQNTFDDDIPF